MNSWVVSPEGVLIANEKEEVVAFFDLYQALQLASAIFNVASEIMNEQSHPDQG